MSKPLFKKVTMLDKRVSYMRKAAADLIVKNEEQKRLGIASISKEDYEEVAEEVDGNDVTVYEQVKAAKPKAPTKAELEAAAKAEAEAKAAADAEAKAKEEGGAQ